jgi:hypothetical protein
MVQRADKGIHYVPAPRCVRLFSFSVVPLPLDDCLAPRMPPLALPFTQQ